MNGFHRFEPKASSSRSSAIHDGSSDRFEASSTNSSSLRAVTTNLAKLIDVKHVSRAVAAKIIDLTSRNAQRNSDENQIIKILSGHLKNISASARLTAFGSTKYGFGGSNTNLNILIDTSKLNSNEMINEHEQHQIQSSLQIKFISILGGAAENPKLILHELAKYFKMPGAAPDFHILASIDGDRVQKKRLQIVHKTSGIRCLIESDSTLSICESSQIIRDCISHAPICKWHFIKHRKFMRFQIDYRFMFICRLPFDRVCTSLAKCCQ